MMNWGPELAVILGIIEGLTEFLPVSSTGHLILVGHALGFTGDIASNVEISIQLGAILAIIAYERTKLASLASHALREQRDFRSLVRGSAEPHGRRYSGVHSGPAQSLVRHRIGIGLSARALVGFLAHKSIKAYLFSPTTVATSLIVGGIIILMVERMQSRVRVENCSRSPAPGPLDRPGPMRLLDTWHVPFRLDDCRRSPGRPRPARRHGILLLSGPPDDDHRHDLPNAEIASSVHSRRLRRLGIGLVVSFVVAWAVIAAFLTFVQRHSLSVFAYYRMVLGIVVLLVVR